MNNKQTSFQRTGIIALLALVVAGGVTYSVSAWSVPNSAAPGGTVSGPITTGATAQTKNGNFTIGSGYSLSASNICLSGSCKTAWPVPTTACIAGQALTWNGASFSCISAGGGSDIWQKNGNDIYYNNGKVGIGTPSPAAPIHIKNTIGDMTFGAANYSGALSGGQSWPNYIGTVVKKGASEVILGVGGLGGDAPGVSAKNSAGPQFDLFANAKGTAVLQSNSPIILQTSQVGIGIFDYGYGEKPLAGAMLHVKGSVLATGYLQVNPAPVGDALIQVKSRSTGVAGIDLESDTNNDSSMIRYQNRALTISGNALDQINLNAPNVQANTKITSPQYCIGGSCRNTWAINVYHKESGYSGDPADYQLSCDAGDQLVSSYSFREAPLLPPTDPFGNAKIAFKTAINGEGMNVSYCGPDASFSCTARIFCLDNI